MRFSGAITTVKVERWPIPPTVTLRFGSLKNYHSLVPHAQSLRQAIFEMEQDEVILANQLKRARASEQDFRALADGILARTT